MTSTTYSHTRNYAPKDYAEGDAFYEPETTLGLGDRFLWGLAVVAALALTVGFYAWVLA
ncbi:hypothetical protein NJB93_21065 [Brucella intermedia]|uniref:hypothetical protein n=1 Tax=Brucella intermedia TaxID=94625 RepID=UPI00209B4812|nr:hypothetical protein [Brucella intermedia]MCO7729051.1 hypothetical protein [Brucella intermedia]